MKRATIQTIIDACNPLPEHRYIVVVALHMLRKQLEIDPIGTKAAYGTYLIESVEKLETMLDNKNE